MSVTYSVAEKENFDFHNDLSRIHTQMNSLKISKLDMWEELNRELKDENNASLTEIMSSIEKALYLTSLDAKYYKPVITEDDDEDEFKGM